MPLSSVTVTGNLADASGAPLAGSITFTPVALLRGAPSPAPVVVADAAGLLVIGPAGVIRAVSGGTFTVSLAATDNPGLTPAGWAYQVTLAIAGVAPPSSFTCLLPSSPASVDLSQIAPAVLAVTMAAYLPLSYAAGAAAGYVWTSDSAGNGSWELPSASHFSQSFTASASVTVAHGLGRFPAVTVIDTADDVCVGDVQYLSGSTLRVSFSAPFSGTVICN